MNSQGPAAVSFEVYTFDGQRWTLHARFQRHERDRAVEEAKYVEHHMMLGCKVVRETYFPGSNTSDEATVYISDKRMLLPRAAPRRAAYAGGRATVSASPLGTGTRKAGADDPKSLGVLARMAMVIAASLAGAGAVAGVANAFLSQLPPQIILGRDMTSLIMFSCFLVSFLAIAVPLAMKYVDWREEWMGSTEKVSDPVVPPVPPASFVPPPPAANAQPAAKTAEETPDPAKDGGAPPEAAVEEPPPPAVDPLDQAQMAAIEPIPDITPDVTATGEDGAPLESEADRREREQREGAEKAEQRKLLMMRFLSQILAEIKKTHPTLDSYNRFGVHLVLTGAVEMLNTTGGIPEKERHALLQTTIQVMGTRADAAQKFAERYEDYLTEPRYLAMVQGGRYAMEGFLAGSRGATSHITLLFDSWNRPQSPQAQSRVVTVMFTDMVGSTDLTQKLGDQAAQDVIRQHNSIVRTALAEHEGREVKHTGDGIMASFPSAGNGVEAAIAIQRAVTAHSRDNPELPFQVRIGLDAGEPIEEDDDLFGTTVQLASRTCAAAAAGEIMCTNVVKELSSGRGYDFVDRGAQQLKGFKDKIELYEIRCPAAE